MPMLPYTGRLLNSIILLVVALAAFSLSYSVLQKAKMDRKMQYFGYFWLATAFLWLSSTIRNLFASFNLLGMDYFFFHMTQIFLYISGAFLGPYMAYKQLSNPRVIQCVVYLYRIIAVLGMFFLFRNGIGVGAIDQFSTEYIPNKTSQIIFLIAVTPLLFASIIDACKHFWKRVRHGEPFYETLAPLSITLYLLVGVVDERGVLGSWQLNLFRLAFLAAFFMAWTATLQESTYKEKQSPTTSFEI